MINKILAIACAMLIGANAASAQRPSINLAGTWQSTLGPCQLPGTTDENRLGGERVTSGPTIQLTRLYPYVGKVSYEKEIDVPAEMAGMRLSLYIERTKPSTLWIDGDSIGHIVQLFAPHVYELPALAPGKHTIRLLVDNSDEIVPAGVRGSHAWTDATQTNWNGVIGQLRIDATPHTYIEQMQVYPDVDNSTATVKMEVRSATDTPCHVQLACTLADGSDEPLIIETDHTLKAGTNHISIPIDLTGNVRLWSEFHPWLYTVEATIDSDAGTDWAATQFGMRKYGVDGTQFTINDKKTFLRGTHDGCVFPLTGYAPATADEWDRLFTIAKSYGINHFRFHSYTPTEAAFASADRHGIYLHTELPMWGTIDTTTVELNEFLRNEAFTTLRFLGNHPSFMALGLGNELWGDTAMMHRWLDEFRAVDPRHLYYEGANNDLGFRGPKDGEDFYTTCRVGDGPGFSTHARGSFSFADAEHGGIINWLRPNTKRDFSNVVSICPRPIVSHETCQFQIYPSYADIPKYTGVLYPYNLITFRDRLNENNLSHQAHDFHRATGLWAIDCYKADMEQCLRTPGFGGYQLLDIKDYPGQGSALVGILDAFADSKGLVEPETFRHWNSPIVPMALLHAMCFAPTDTIIADLVISNYTEADYAQPLSWSFEAANMAMSGVIDDVRIGQGTVGQAARISLPLSGVKRSAKGKLHLSTGEYSNSYDVWVYAPSDSQQAASSVMLADSLSAQVIDALEQGRTVLLTPRHADIEQQSMGGLFTPDYWNYAMFKTISENNGKPVSPGTMGMLMDPEHPLFRNFPTDGRSSWQWWSIALNSRPLILNALTDYTPVIQTVDNIERNHKLGILMEMSVGAGKLLISTTDLDAIKAYPEGKAFVDALLNYAASADCNPAYTATTEQVRQILYTATDQRDIQGVRNITDYKAPQ